MLSENQEFINHYYTNKRKGYNLVLHKNRKNKTKEKQYYTKKKKRQKKIILQK